MADRIKLEDLSTDHISEWLSKKRAQGRYLHHDEHFVLEQLQNYCQSKGVKYDDYVAAYRNAFEWRSCQPKQVTGGEPSKYDLGKQAIIRGLQSVSTGFAR